MSGTESHESAPAYDPLRAFLSGKRRSERQVCSIPVEVRGGGAAVPGVAQGGLQMGAYAGRIIRAEIDSANGVAREPFIYRDKGTMAVIGKAKAVAQIGSWHFTGFFGWFLWGAVHILFLIGFRNRLQVIFSWFWTWLINARDARLITGAAKIRIEVPRTHHFADRAHRSNSEN